MSVPVVSSGAFNLLRQNTAFRALWLSRTTSFIGDALGTIALLLFVFGAEGSGVAVAILFLAVDFAPSLLSPLTGTLSDRMDRKRLMIRSEIAQGAIITTIALVEMPLALIFVLVAFRSVLGGMFQPASRSAVPDLVPERQLETANAVIGFGTHGFEVLGPLLGAALLPLLGVRGLLLADAATFVVSALLLMRLPSLAPVRLEEGRLSFLGDAGEGLRFLWRMSAMRVLTIGFCTVVAFSGVDDVALVFLARGPLEGTESDASVLYGGTGVGLLFGFLLLARIAPRVPGVWLISAGFAIGSLGNLLTGVSWAVGIAFTMQAVRGIGISMIEVGVQTFVQRTVPKGMQGRAFANLFGAVGLAGGFSYMIGGPLLDLIGPRLVLVIGGAGGLIAVLVVDQRLPHMIRATRSTGRG